MTIAVAGDVKHRIKQTNKLTMAVNGLKKTLTDAKYNFLLVHILVTTSGDNGCLV